MLAAIFIGALANAPVQGGDEPLRTLDTRFVLSGHDGGVYTVAFVPEREHLLVSAGYDDGSVHLWDLRERRRIDVIEYDSAASRPRDFAFAPDGRSVAVLLSYGAINSYPITDQGFGERERYWGKSIGRHGRLAISREGTFYAIASRNLPITVANVARHEEYQPYAGTEDYRAVAFGAGDSIFAAADGSNRLALWDILANEGFGARQSYAIEGVTATTGTWGLAFSRDGRHLATAHVDGHVTCWQVDGLEAHQVHTLSLRQSAFTPAFSADGRLLAASSQDGAVHLWNVRTGVLAKVYKGRVGSLLSLDVAHSAAAIAAGSLAGPIVVWTRDGS